MIIHLDSHLRERYFMDRVYNLPDPYARFTPQKSGEAGNRNAKWFHQLDPGDPQARAAIDIPTSTTLRSTGAAAKSPRARSPAMTWSSASKDIKRDGIERQVFFPTGISGEDHILMAIDYPRTSTPSSRTWFGYSRTKRSQRQAEG